MKYTEFMLGFGLPVAVIIFLCNMLLLDISKDIKVIRNTVTQQHATGLEDSSQTADGFR